MTDMASSRYVLRVAALVLPVLAVSVLVIAPGVPAYALVALAALLVAIAMATSSPDDRRRVWLQSRLEFLLGGAALLGILAATFAPVSPPPAVIALIAATTAVFLGVLAIRMFGRLRTAVRRH